MKVLFDQGTPVPLRGHLSGHQIETAFEREWERLSNGDLIRASEEAGFDVFVTTDQSLRYQQDLSRRSISILVLNTTAWPLIQFKVAEIAEALGRMSRGDYVEVDVAS